MKTVYDLSELDGVLGNKEWESIIKKEIVKHTPSPAFRERFLYIPIEGNKHDDFAFEYLNCYIALHLKRIYSTKTWKPKKDIYTIEAFQIMHSKRNCVYDDFTNTVYEKKLIGTLSEIEQVDET